MNHYHLPVKHGCDVPPLRYVTERVRQGHTGKQRETEQTPGKAEGRERKKSTIGRMEKWRDDLEKGETGTQLAFWSSCTARLVNGGGMLENIY